MNWFKSSKSIFNYIWESPSNKGQKIYRFYLAILWQFYKRMVALPLISRLDNGAKFILEPHSTNSSGNIYVKTYESEYIYFLRENIIKGGLILDIGAHMGLYTLLLNDLFLGGYCFEPAPDNFKALSTNLFINDFIQQYLPVKSAVSDKSGTLSLKIQGTFSGINYLSDFNEPGVDSQSVPVVSIDSFLSEKEQKELRFIKIDTEGNELKVLLGSVNTLKSNPQVIVLVENYSPTELIAFFSSIHFKVFAIDKNGKIHTDKHSISNSYNLLAVGMSHPLFNKISLDS